MPVILIFSIKENVSNAFPSVIPVTLFFRNFFIISKLITSYPRAGTIVRAVKEPLAMKDEPQSVWDQQGWEWGMETACEARGSKGKQGRTRTCEHTGTCICLPLLPLPTWMMWVTCSRSQWPSSRDTQAPGWDFMKSKTKMLQNWRSHKVRQQVGSALCDPQRCWCLVLISELGGAHLLHLGLPNIMQTASGVRPNLKPWGKGILASVFPA